MDRIGSRATIEQVENSMRDTWPVAMVAEIVGKSRRQVYYDIEANKLPVERRGERGMVVHKADLIRYLKYWN